MKNLNTLKLVGAMSIAIASVSAKAENAPFSSSGRSSCNGWEDHDRVAKEKAYESAHEACTENGYSEPVRLSDFEFEYICGGCISNHYPEGRCATKATAEFQCAM